VWALPEVPGVVGLVECRVHDDTAQSLGVGLPYRRPRPAFKVSGSRPVVIRFRGLAIGNC
jgi:hypothetical protein